MHPPVPAPFPAPPATLPRAPGIGFKPQHADALLNDPGPVAWLEVHAENYLAAGGPRPALLRRMADRFPVSVHGVGLSIGGAQGIDRDHLARVAALVRDLPAAQFSEHLAWSSHDGAYLDDLLPLPLTDATLATVCRHVDQVQDAMGRPMLLENPASYLTFPESTWPEPAFLAEIARRTGCGLLLDVTNVTVSAANIGIDPVAYLDGFALDRVGEIHLAGAVADAGGSGLMIDAHAAPVPAATHDLCARVLAATGPLPVLIEWDNDVPDFPVLRAEAEAAAGLLARARQQAVPA